MSETNPASASGPITTGDQRPSAAASEAAHTPTPWVARFSLSNARTGVGDWFFVDANGNPVLLRGSQTGKTGKSAEQIARAVNAHADLVAALRAFLQWANTPNGQQVPGQLCRVCEEAEAALSKSGAQP